MYRELERFQELGDLYLRRAEATAAPTEASVYRLQLARLRAGELGDPEGAVDQLEEIVQALPAHAGALDELEKLTLGKDQLLQLVRAARGKCLLALTLVGAVVPVRVHRVHEARQRQIERTVIVRNAGQ